MRYGGRALLLSVILLTACAGGIDYQTYLARKRVTQTAPESFDHCHGYGCRLVSTVTLGKTDWNEIGRLFRKVKTAEQERASVAAAIGLLETKSGAQAGTGGDRGGTYIKIGDGQHDCVDESVNTTVYLAALRQKKLLKHHDIAAPRSRLPLLGLGLGPHQTAVIIEKETGERYAVDSWFHDNGHAAEIVPMDEWFFGWRPDTNDPAR